MRTRANRTQRKAVALLTLGVAGAAATGCGDDAPVRSRMSDRGPTAPKTAAVDASSAGRFAGDGHLATQDKPTTTRGITVTPIARYSGRVAISRRQGFLAVAVGGPDELELRTSWHGESPQVAAGAGAIPSWADIHVGMDGGRPIVTYPRCSAPDLGSCDLYTWNATTRRESPVAGASDPGRAETEGVVDTGDVLFTVEPDPDVNQRELGNDGKPPALWLGQDGAAPREIAAEGGRHLALSGNTLADLKGACGERVRLLDQAGAERFHFQSHCGFNEPVESVGASLEQGALFFALAKLDMSMVVYRVPLGATDRGDVESASIGIPAVEWAASGPTSGYAAVGETCAGRRFDENDTKRACKLVEVTGIDPN